jgi:hypothetical protein
MAPFNLGGVGSLLTNLAGAAAAAPDLLNVGKSTSFFNKAAGYVPGLRSNPQTDIGRRLWSAISGDSTIGTIPSKNSTGESYRDAELRLAAAARAAGGPSAGGGIGGGNMGSFVPYASHLPSQGGSDPAERAYREQLNNTAQQTAQNPLFQKYQVADLTKQYNEAKTPQEKQSIGLQIWAQTNPLLAAKLKTGQTGYTEAQAAPGISNSGGSLIGSLAMPTTKFDFTADVSTPGMMGQTFGAPIPGIGMVSTTPQIPNDFNPQATLPNNLIQSAYAQQLTSAPDFQKVAKDSMFLRRAYAQQGLQPLQR